MPITCIYHFTNFFFLLSPFHCFCSTWKWRMPWVYSLGYTFCILCEQDTQNFNTHDAQRSTLMHYHLITLFLCYSWLSSILCGACLVYRMSNGSYDVICWSIYSNSIPNQRFLSHHVKNCVLFSLLNCWRVMCVRFK